MFSSVWTAAGAVGSSNTRVETNSEVLEAIRDSNLKQSRADLEYQVHWSRHLMVCLQRITGAQLLVGARAVMFHPRFSHFVSPDTQDVLLGAETKWPDAPAILVLDSYPWTARSEILTLASKHSKPVKPVRVLRQEESSHAAREDLTAHACTITSLARTHRW